MAPRMWEWHAICQDVYKGVEGPEWENLNYKFVEMNKAVNLEKRGVNKKPRALWSITYAKASGEAYYDQSCERRIENRASVRHALWEAHMSSPTAAMEALRRTEEVAGRAQSIAASRETRATCVGLPSQSRRHLFLCGFHLVCWGVPSCCPLSLVLHTHCCNLLRSHQGWAAIARRGLGRETCTGIASDTSKLERVFQFLGSFWQCVCFFVWQMLHPARTLVMRLGVQQLLQRGATTPPSQNHLFFKKKRGKSCVAFVAMQRQLPWNSRLEAKGGKYRLRFGGTGPGGAD